MMKIFRNVQIRHIRSFPTQSNIAMFNKDGMCECADKCFLRISDDMPWCKRCTPPFFTIFRDPLERVYSAYNYCIKVLGHDPLCAYNEPITDICSFAKRWGNYQFDKFLTVPYIQSPRRIHAYASKWTPDREVFRRSEFITKKPKEGEPYLSGVYANKMMLAHYGLNDLSTPQGKLHLQRVLSGLETSFAAIGILERWNETMAVFREFTGCREFDPNISYKQNTADSPRRKKNIPRNLNFFPEKSSVEVKRDWEKCLPVVRDSYMAADIQIYNAAKEIFERQLKHLNGK